MISANFAVALVTVVLRGLLDRLYVVAPAAGGSIVPSSTGVIIASGIVYYLYNRLTSGRKIQINYSLPNKRPKILDGRIHKASSRCSSACNLLGDHTWLPPRQFRPIRPRSRCRSNLLTATRSSLQTLNNECSSYCSLSSKSGSSLLKCQCDKDHTPDRSIIKESPTPSVYSVKSDGENLPESVDLNKNEQEVERVKCIGDCDCQKRKAKCGGRRRKIKTNRKTRSGKIYSSYL